MTNTIFKHIVERRAELDTQARVARFVLSSENLDRAGDVIRIDGWELARFRSNPVMLWSHNHALPAIGTVEPVQIEGRELVGDCRYATAEQNPHADTIWKLVQGDIIRTGSVGFVPLEWTWDDERGGINFMRHELIEYSMTNVPMNADATRRAIKSAGVEIDELCALEGLPSAAIDDFRETLLAESASQRKAAIGRLRNRVAVANAKTKGIFV